MKTFKILTTALVFSVMAALTQAQEKRGMPTPEQQIERIEQAVGKLSSEQKTKITGIMAKARETAKKARESTNDAGQDQRKGKMLEFMQKQRAEIRAVLTPEQQKKYDEMASRGGREGRGKGRGEGGDSSGERKRKSR